MIGKREIKFIIFVIIAVIMMFMAISFGNEIEAKQEKRIRDIESEIIELQDWVTSVENNGINIKWIIYILEIKNLWIKISLRWWLKIPYSYNYD